MKRLLSILCLLVTTFVVDAQQDAEYSMYFFNGLYVNPAYAGSKEAPSLSAIYRHQWAGIEGAPRSASLAFHTPFRKDQNNLGLLFTTDHLGVTDMFSLNAAYSYKVKITNDFKFNLAVSAGFTHYSSDLSDLTLPDGQLPDDAFAVNKNLFIPNIGFGAYLYHNKYFVGVAVPHLLNNSLHEKLKVEGTELVARQYKHWMVTAGYVFGEEDAFVKFKPSILMKYVKNAPIDFDFSANFLFVDRYWAGISYRMGGDDDRKVGDAIIGVFEFLVTQQFRLGYAYDHTLSSLGDFNSGTHEIMVGYEFGFEMKRFVSPRYIKYF